MNDGDEGEGIFLTCKQVDMLVEALLSSNQLRKGRRAWLVKMLGRCPEDSVKKPIAQCDENRRSPETLEAKEDDGLKETGKHNTLQNASENGGSILLQDTLEKNRMRERELLVLNRVGLVGCGEIAQVGTKSE